MTCSSNSKCGRQRKINGHRSVPHNPLKMPQHRSRKMPDDRSGPCKCTDTSVTCRMRGQRSSRCKIPEKRSGGSRMHDYRSRPHKTPEHRISLYKMLRHRRSCKASVCAIRSSGKRCPGEPENCKKGAPDGAPFVFSIVPVLSGYPDRSLVTAVRFIVSNAPGLGSSCTEMTVRAGLRSPMIST